MMFIITGNAPKECFYNDDIWFSGHIAKNKVDRLVIPMTQRPWHKKNTTTYPDPTNKNSISRKPLWSINRDGNNSNIIVNHFIKYWDATKEEKDLYRYYQNKNYKGLNKLLKEVNLAEIDRLFIFNAASIIRDYLPEDSIRLYEYLIRFKYRSIQGLSCFHLGNLYSNIGEIKKARHMYKRWPERTSLAQGCKKSFIYNRVSIVFSRTSNQLREHYLGQPMVFVIFKAFF